MDGQKHYTRVIPFLVAGLAGVLWAPACGDGGTEPAPPEPARPASIAVEPATASLTWLGEAVVFRATVVDQYGAAFPGTVTWSSSDEAVFTIDAGGTVTAVANGSGTATAMFQALSATAAVVVEQAPASLETVSGEDQRARAAAPLPEPVVVRVADAGGSPVAGVTIAFTPGEGHGTADPAEVLSDTAGFARTVWTLGEPEAQTLTAAVADGPSVQVAATVLRPNELVRALEVVSGDGQRAAPGAPLPESVVVRALDGEGSPVAGATVRFTPGVGHGRADPAEALTGPDGLARTAWTLGPAVGGQTLHATVSETSALVAATADNADRAALEAFYHATGGPDWANDDNWLTDAPLGDWHGVAVDEYGRVAAIDMYRNKLMGALPPEIGDLTGLKTLDFTANSGLTGEVPAEIGRLSKLAYLSFANTRITSLPPEVGNLRQLEYLALHRTLLTSLPPEFGNLSALQEVDLEDSQLTSLPPEFANLSRLAVLDLQGNRLAGDAPLRMLANLTGLIDLDVQGNELNGAIPPQLGALSWLSALNLASNNLEGAIPPELGRLTRLTQLRVSNNAALSGPLPASLAELVNLEQFWAGGTDLCAPETLRGWLAGFANRIRVCQGASVRASAAYLTQAVQSLDFPVPLVADEPALLRVFAVATNSSGQSLPSARALFYNNDEEVYRVDIPSTGGVLTTGLDESSLSSSLNAAIPAEVIQPGLEMVVELDPDGKLDASVGLGRRVPAEGRLPVVVKEAPALDLTLIPFLSVTNPDSSVLARTDGLTPEDPLFHDIHTLLPVREIDLTVHEPVETSASNPFEVIGEVIAIRAMEGASGHYMGTIAGFPLNVPAGVAVAPGRVSYAILEPSTMAHELGHNFSLLHAPCRTGSVDPFYPQDDGKTGGWGYDVQQGTLVSPEDTYDLMSYCDPDWISDYSFTKALGYRLTDTRGRAAAPARTLLIWGGVEADGTPFLEPAFVVDVPPNLPQPGGGGHTIVGMAADGTRLFSLEFTMPELADGDGGSRFAFALPVKPDWTALASITLSGNQRSFTLEGEGDRAVAIVRDSDTRRVRAILRSDGAAELGAMALGDRATVLSALQPGLEILFSRGIPDLAISGR